MIIFIIEMYCVTSYRKKVIQKIQILYAISQIYDDCAIL